MAKLKAGTLDYAVEHLRVKFARSLLGSAREKTLTLTEIRSIAKDILFITRDIKQKSDLDYAINILQRLHSILENRHLGLVIETE